MEMGMNHGDMQMEMDSMISGLEGKSGKEFDKAFLSEMIVHHEGAVKMAEMAQKSASDARVKALAEAIITAQNKEIKDMKAWLSEMK